MNAKSTKEITELLETSSLIHATNRACLDKKDDTALMELMGMLTYARPARGLTEYAFISDYIAPLYYVKDLQGNTLNNFVDGYGNIIIIVPEGDGSQSPILWSSHTDTVHKDDGRVPIMLEGGVIKSMGASCLGADCTTGVWLMINMIRKLVPGTYVFHRDEEIGGLGSSYIAKEKPRWLAGLSSAVAFDRYGDTSIITHQSGGRCASDAWATKFANLLNSAGPMNKFVLDDGGTFTDTANYTSLIGECTNISVGYDHQHTKKETQDWRYALWLLNAMTTLNFSELHDTTRGPGEIDYSHRDYSRYYAEWDDAVYKASIKSDRVPYTLHELVYDFPNEVADVLASYGVTFNDLKADLEFRGVEID